MSNVLVQRTSNSSRQIYNPIMKAKRTLTMEKTTDDIQKDKHFATNTGQCKQVRIQAPHFQRRVAADSPVNCIINILAKLNPSATRQA